MPCVEDAFGYRFIILCISLNWVFYFDHIKPNIHINTRLFNIPQACRYVSVNLAPSISMRNVINKKGNVKRNI